MSYQPSKDVEPASALILEAVNGRKSIQKIFLVGIDQVITNSLKNRWEGGKYVSIWLHERTLENLRIELERLERYSMEKQDDFQRATRRGEVREARRLRKEQLQIDEKIRLLTRDLILVQKRIQEESSQQSSL